jgi:hypothetical protein
MFDTTQDLIDTNNRAVTALNQCLERLHELSIGALPQEKSFLQAQISRTTSQINLLNITNSQLVAAGVLIQPLSHDAKNDLLGAFQRVDHAIVQDEVIGAAIDTINDILAATVTIGTITRPM